MARCERTEGGPFVCQILSLDADTFKYQVSGTKDRSMRLSLPSKCLLSSPWKWYNERIIIIIIMFNAYNKYLTRNQCQIRALEFTLKNDAVGRHLLPRLVQIREWRSGPSLAARLGSDRTTLRPISALRCGILACARGCWSCCWFLRSDEALPSAEYLGLRFRWNNCLCRREASVEIPWKWDSYRSIRRPDSTFSLNIG